MYIITGLQQDPDKELEAGLLNHTDRPIMHDASYPFLAIFWLQLPLALLTARHMKSSAQLAVSSGLVPVNVPLRRHYTQS